MKVVIPVAGAGAKLRPFTYTQPKCLIPLAGKTILSFIIDQFIENGINEFVFVIGHLGDKIRNYVLEKHPEIKSEFVIQVERDGIGHALFQAKDCIPANEPFIIAFGDTICDYDIKQLINSKHSCFTVDKVEDPRNFGVVEIDKNRRVISVAEKPAVPMSNLALTGIYKIVDSQKLFSCIEVGLQSKQKEKFDLTDAIERLIKEGQYFEAIQVENWYDCGRKESLLETNASILKKLEFMSDEVPFFDNTIIVHPVSIAEGCNIQNSIIGPNVTIGENTVINYGIISNSIIGSYSLLERVDFEKSLIGSDAVIRGKSQSLNVGDNTELDLS